MKTNEGTEGTGSPARRVRAAVRAMRGYTPGEQVTGAIKLNTNECAYGPSPRVKETLARIADESLRLYPDPVSRRLRETAAALYGISAESILAGNGSDDCLTVVYRATLSPGDRVLTPAPTYGLYETLSVLQGASHATVPYRREGRRWDLPPELADGDARLILIANPNNPSGTVVPVDDLRRLCDVVPAMVVVDEAYIDFARPPGGAAGAPPPSMLPVLAEHENLVVLRTFSKSFSLAGARLGLLFAAAPVVAELMKVKDSYNVNALSQALGTAALEDGEHHREVIRKTLDERARLEKNLAALGFTWPESAANFLLCEVPDGPGDKGARAEAIYQGLKKHGVLVRWWDTPDLRGSLRITVGRPYDNEKLLEALRKVLGG